MKARILHLFILLRFEKKDKSRDLYSDYGLQDKNVEVLKSKFFCILGLCSVPVRETFSSVVYVLEEESEEEGDGVYEFMHGSQVLQ